MEGASALVCGLEPAVWPNGAVRRFYDGHDRKSHPSLAVASLDKMLHDNYLCWVESNKQQFEVRSKIQAKNSKTRATRKPGFFLCYSVSIAFS